MTRFAHLHEIEFSSRFDLVVDVGNRTRFRLIRPRRRALQSASVRAFFHKFGDFRIEFGARILNDNSGAVRHEIVTENAARRRHHIRMQIIVIITAHVDIHQTFGTIRQDTQLVVPAHLFKNLARLVGGHRDTLDRHIRFYNSVHLVAHLVGGFGHVEPFCENLTENRTRRIVAEANTHVGIKIVKRHCDDISQTCLVRLDGLLIVNAQKLNGFAVVLARQFAIEFLDLRAELAHDVLTLVLRGQQIDNSRAFFDLYGFVVNINFYHSFSPFTSRNSIRNVRFSAVKSHLFYFMR